MFEGGPQALADDRDHVAVFLSGNGKEAILLLAGFFGTDELKSQAGPDLSREQPGEIAEQGRGEALEHAAGEGAVHIEEPRVGLADVEREAQPLVFTVGGGGIAEDAFQPLHTAPHPVAFQLHAGEVDRGHELRPAVVGGAEQRGALGLELLLRDVEQVLEQLVAPIGGRFAVEGGVAAVEKDAARRVLGLRLGCGDEGRERLPGRRDGGGAVGGVFVERVPDDLGDGLALLVGFTVLAHRFKHVGEFVMGEHEFAGISGGFQFAQAVVKEGDDFFGGCAPPSEAQGMDPQRRAPELAVGLAEEGFDRGFHLVTRDGRVAPLLEDVEEIQHERIEERRMGDPARGGAQGFVAEDAVGGVGAARKMVVDGEGAHGAGSDLMVLLGRDAVEEVVDFDNRFVQGAFTEEQEAQVGDPEHGDEAFPGEFGGLARGFDDAGGERVLAQVHGGLAGAEGKGLEKAFVPPVILRGAARITLQGFTEMALEEVLDAFKDRDAILHVLFLEMAHLFRTVEKAVRERRLSAREQLQVMPEDPDHGHEAFAAVAGRKLVGERGEFRGELEVVV